MGHFIGMEGFNRIELRENPATRDRPAYKYGILGPAKVTRALCAANAQQNYRKTRLEL